MKKKLLTLAISSYAVHGTASLKVFMQTLGHRLLPVPSKMLNGLTNMAMVTTFDPPFEALLQGTFDLAVHRGVDVVLFIGYLGKAENAEIISWFIEKYRNIIKYIIVDPVSGDHGRLYVDTKVVEQWPVLIQQADLVFPNLTEVKIFAKHQPGEQGDEKFFISAFTKLFPLANLVVTSLRDGEENIGIQSFGKRPFSYFLPALPKNFGGTGDVFVAHFILNHFYKGLPFEEALKTAAEETHHIIAATIEAGVDDLLLDAV